MRQSTFAAVLAMAVVTLTLVLVACDSALDGESELTTSANVVDGGDVKVTVDNANANGGRPTPSFDAKNRQANETTVAISPVDSDIVAVGGNDYRMVPEFGDAWLGVYVSDDGGDTWFNTFVPGFPTDASPAGNDSPLLGLDGSGDPVVRFDAEGNLFVGGLAFDRDFDQGEQSTDNIVYVAKYAYTPGTPGGLSTPTAAANPPNFTYEFTTIVDEGAVGFGLPAPSAFGFAGKFDDKNWMAIDTHETSPCYGTIYYSYTMFTGLAGAFPIMVSRSTDGGTSFAQPKPVSQKGKDGSLHTQGSNIAVAPDGTVYVAYRTFASRPDPTFDVQVVRSDDCGRRFGKPVRAASFEPMPRLADGLRFRTPTNAWIAADDTDSDSLYVAYMALDGNPANADIFTVRSSDGGATWEDPEKVNDDATYKHQFWPAITVLEGVLHVAWYGFRESGSPTDPAADNDNLHVFYASTDDYPTFSHNIPVTDDAHNPNCLMFGGGTAAFHGDYIELDARVGNRGHVVHLAWADNRDVDPCDLDSDPGYGTGGELDTGVLNQNIYADELIVSP